MAPTASPSLIVVVIYTMNLTSSQFVDLSASSKGKLVGGLLVGPNLSDRSNTTLVTSFSDSGVDNVFNQQVLASRVLNITLLDEDGTSITQLDAPLIICLAPPDAAKKGDTFCLSYFDEKKEEWRCEDECLTDIPTKGEETGERSDLVCGETRHLTNFALLLTGGNSACQSSRDNTLSWVSLGMVAGAVVLVAFCGLVAEIQVRWRLRRQAIILSKASSTLFSFTHFLEQNWSCNQQRKHKTISCKGMLCTCN